MKVIMLQTPIDKFFESMGARVIGPKAFGEEFTLHINVTDLVIIKATKSLGRYGTTKSLGVHKV
ncbi:MAG: hypothetical protein ACI9LG_002281 [Moritella dasanensis]|jgi:hypothetical protein